MLHTHIHESYKRKKFETVVLMLFIVYNATFAWSFYFSKPVNLHQQFRGNITFLPTQLPCTSWKGSCELIVVPTNVIGGSSKFISLNYQDICNVQLTSEFPKESLAHQSKKWTDIQLQFALRQVYT